MRIQNRIMLGAVIFVLCAAAAYAQISISSIPTTQVRNTGRAELSGAVRVTATAATLAGDNFTIRYGVPITNDVTHGIVLNDAVTPGTTGATWPGGCVIAGIDYLNGVITITGCPAAAPTQYFQLSGVRVSLDGFSAPVNATIGSLLNPITAGQQSAQVIESAGPGLVLAASAPNGAATGNVTGVALTYLGNTTGIVATGKLLLKEGFASAWKTQAEDGGAPGATTSTQILLTVTGLPAGVNLVPAVIAPGATSATSAGVAGTVTYPSAFFGQLAITSSFPTAVVTITADNLASVDVVEIDFTLSFGAVTLPLGANTYNVTATLTPNAAALTAANLPVTPANTAGVSAYAAPKFAVSTVSQGILTILANTTNLLIPYLSTQATYDTGIAIANTTTDPFGGAANGGASAQNGTITFNFYPNDGTTIPAYTTAAGSPGSGLTAAGVLNSGSTYTVLLSQLLRAAAPSRTATFAGYVVVVVGASDCHGIAFISDFAGKFTSYTPALVLPYLSATGGTRTGITFEGLNQ